jgi:hypothetical protein
VIDRDSWGGLGTPRRFRAALAGIVASLVLLGCAGVGGGSSPSDQIDAYCSYGAVSQAQLDGCITHVTVGDIDRLDTNAARYSRSELDKCLYDSGPFCDGQSRLQR